MVCHPDTASCKFILLWDDILIVFSNALSGTVALPLDPLRFAAVPGVTLDVVVGRLTGLGRGIVATRVVEHVAFTGTISEDSARGIAGHSKGNQQSKPSLNP
ncbi:hypothetical protein BGZ96_006606 [Linnemannia gamsii]|uniref:Uncharacterized protein n=1 Tax=Linnemannia gamsii TaxID=64522 RepID=A0ABQ7K3Q4_9FUNG|nr:hypothetical protein BGZ96_006606 [Linnemannia gamsii]